MGRDTDFFQRGARLMAVSLILILFTTGCAVQYYDRSTGTEHLWGFGHLKMRAVPRPMAEEPGTNSVMAFVTGARTAGLSFGFGQDFTGLTAGLDARSRLIIKNEESQFALVWPTNSIWLPNELRDLFTVRVGSNFPLTNGVPADPVSTHTPNP
jgi:hypothetical protein